MVYVNTKKSALYLSANATLPTAPAGFIELSDEFVVNPDSTVEEYNRVSSLLGGTDSFADTCHVVLNQSISTMMRTNDKAGTALPTPPECSALFQVCGMDETIGADTVKYVNSQAPKIGSAVLNVDGKQHTSTNSVVADATWVFEIGKPAKFEASLSGFLDNQGIATDTSAVTTPLSLENNLMMSCADIVLADGTAVQADMITIAMGAQISEKYALGVKEFQMTDYVIKFTASFFVGSANYKDAQQKLIDQDVDVIKCSFNTASGTLVDGQSLLVEAGNAKASSYSDTSVDSTVKREQTWLLRPDATGNNLTFTYGKLS